MAGLRDRQKRDREQRLLDAATVLFRNHGYEATRIEMIAEMAGLSVGTLYNYYRNKGDLLAAIVGVEVGEVLRLGEALVAAPPEDVVTALDALVAIYYDHSLIYLDKAMWRHAIALTTQHPETPFAKAYMELDAGLCAQATALVRALQARGRVAATVDPETVGELVFNNLDRMFLAFLRDEAMTLAALKACVARHHRALGTALAAPVGKTCGPGSQTD